MDSVAYSVNGGLAETQLASLHAAALRVIEEVGVHVTHPALLRAAGAAPGARVSGSRVRLPAALVDEHVRDYRKRRAAAAAAPGVYTIEVLTGFAFQYLDPHTGALRPMDTATCIETARLVDALHAQGVRGGTPGLPQDVPPQLREILAFKIGCQHSRTAMHVGVSSAQSAKYVYEMGLAAGMPFHFPVFCLSPLRVEGETIDLPGVIEKRLHKTYQELVLDKKTEPRQILTRLVESGRKINRFEVSTPSLNEIFIEVAGKNEK